MRPARETTVLVTGSTDGIGLQTALVLAREGCEVIVHGRSPERVERACELIRSEVPNARLGQVTFDLGSFESVRQGARDVLTRFPHLNVLLNNAGIFAHDNHKTADGYESTFHVNHLGPFLLTMLLVDRLKANAPARIVNVASVAHVRGTLERDIDQVNALKGYPAYAASKLANVHFSFRLAKELEGSGVTVNALHPGVITTKLLASGFGMEGASLEEGARTSVMLALSPEVEGVSGRYYSAGAETDVAPHALDEGVRDALWEYSLKATGLV